MHEARMLAETTARRVLVLYRRLDQRFPGPVRVLRGGAKLTWWTLTLRLPQKLRERSQRQAQIAALRQGGIADPARADGLATRSPRRLRRFDGLSADIIVPVHNSAEDVARCLASIARHRRENDRLILIDDGSAAETMHLLATFAADRRYVTLLRNETATGYTRAANKGLALSRADYAVLLNSDTIVTPDWVNKLIAAGESAPEIGIVGPLSNAASWQSIPERFSDDGDWAVNDLPPRFDAALMSRVVEAVSPAAPHLRSTLVNGFCFAIKRTLIDTIGVLDEANFPQGYGEENDYCFRAEDAGFTCALALDAYVYHAKSRSFTHERRRILSKQGGERLRALYGEHRIAAATDGLRHHPMLEAVRGRLARALAGLTGDSHPSVLFLLPCAPGGGGVHSVMQEAAGLAQLGARTRVAVPQRFLALYRAQYPPALSDALIAYEFDEALAEAAGVFDVCVATLHLSVPLLAAIRARHPQITPCYYAQDYEPMFYPPESDQRREAAETYNWASNAVVFAKTNWIRDTIEAQHQTRVFRVEPSLDHNVYHANRPPHAPPPVRITAMVRPATPRRGAARTLRVLERLQELCGDAVRITVFGAPSAEIAAEGLAFPRGMANAGRLPREGVAALLRESDVFLDLSDYQAFGRTALEAMACGVAVVAPQVGGAEEFARDGENALLIDTEDEAACLAAAQRLVVDSELRTRLQSAGAEAAAAYSITRAALSELALFHAAARGGRKNS